MPFYKMTIQSHFFPHTTIMKQHLRGFTCNSRAGGTLDNTVYGAIHSELVQEATFLFYVDFAHSTAYSGNIVR